jgi:hypothetical protein
LNTRETTPLSIPTIPATGTEVILVNVVEVADGSDAPTLPAGGEQSAKRTRKTVTLITASHINRP